MVFEYATLENVHGYGPFQELYINGNTRPGSYVFSLREKNEYPVIF
jgi:hypothetical protein